jgi:hypothetical protein
MSHNVFINTNQPLHGSSRQALFILPDGVMSAPNGKSLRLTLISFSMKANTISNINSGNSRFYVVHKPATTGDPTFAPVQIPVGNYHIYQGTNGLVQNIVSSLETAIQTLAGVGATTVAGAQNLKTDLIDFTFTGLTGDLKLVCFTVGGDVSTGSSLVAEILAGATQDQKFNSSYEIFGGANEARLDVPGATKRDQFDSLIGMLTGTKGSVTTMMPPRLTDLENVYLRTSLPGTNWATSDFDRGNDRLPEFRISNILAKIHIDNPYQDDTFAEDYGGTAPFTLKGNQFTYKSRGLETIFYQDSGAGLWQTTLPVPSISQIELTLSDEYGRELYAPTLEADENNLTGFQCCIRVEVV